MSNEALQDIVKASQQLTDAMKRHNIIRDSEEPVLMVKMDRVTGLAFEEAINTSMSAINTYRPTDMCGVGEWFNLGQRRVKIAGVWYDWSHFDLQPSNPGANTKRHLREAAR